MFTDLFLKKVKSTWFKRIITTTIGLLALLVIAIPTFNMIQKEAEAKQLDTFSNPEGMLMIEFKDDINLSYALGRTSSQLIGVSSITGYTKHSSDTLPFQYTGEASESNPLGVTPSSRASWKYKQAYKVYINELETIKEKGSVSKVVEVVDEDAVGENEELTITESQAASIDTIVNSYSFSDFRNAKNQTGWLYNNIYIDSVTLVGNYKHLYYAEKRINSKTESTQLINLKEQQQKAEKTAQKIEVKTQEEITKQESQTNQPLTEDEKLHISLEIAQKEFETELKNIPNTPNMPSQEEISLLESLSEDQIKAIDTKITTDKDGNSIISQNQIDTVPGVSTEQAKLVKTMIDKTNNQDDIAKETNHLQPIMQKSLIDPEDSSKSLSTRVMEVLGGGVEADAWCRPREFIWMFRWYGFTSRVNTCWANQIRWAAATAKASAAVASLLSAGANLVAVLGLMAARFIYNMANLAYHISINCRNGGWATIQVRYFHPRHWSHC